MLKKIILSIAAIFLILSCSVKEYYGSSAAESYPVESRIMKEFDFEYDEVELQKSEYEEVEDGENLHIDSRKRIYHADTHLIVESVEESRDNIETLCVNTGGYVTQISDQFISIKIPAQSFNTTLEMILELGQVESKNIYTYDVTDYYSDTELQLETARRTRERLQLLLGESTDPEERAKILKEIGRLTEEIELIRNRLALLDLNVTFSTISVQLTPRLTSDSVVQNNPFSWIANLYPLSSATSLLKAKFLYKPDSSFAVFTKKDYFHAENSQGTSIRFSSVMNHPEGDSDFWLGALEFYLSSYYREHNIKEFPLGDKTVKGLEFISKDRDAFKYFVGIIVENSYIHVLELYTPNANNSLDGLYESFEEGELK